MAVQKRKWRLGKCQLMLRLGFQYNADISHKARIRNPEPGQAAAISSCQVVQMPLLYRTVTLALYHFSSLEGNPISLDWPFQAAPQVANGSRLGRNVCDSCLGDRAVSDSPALLPCMHPSAPRAAEWAPKYLCALAVSSCKGRHMLITIKMSPG